MGPMPSLPDLTLHVRPSSLVGSQKYASSWTAFLRSWANFLPSSLKTSTKVRNCQVSSATRHQVVCPANGNHLDDSFTLFFFCGWHHMIINSRCVHIWDLSSFWRNVAAAFQIVSDAENHTLPSDGEPNFELQFRSTIIGLEGENLFHSVDSSKPRVVGTKIASSRNATLSNGLVVRSILQHPKLFCPQSTRTEKHTQHSFASVNFQQKKRRRNN